MIFDPRTDQEFVDFLRLKSPMSLKARRAMLVWSQGSTLREAALACGLTPARVRAIWCREYDSYKKYLTREAERARLRAGIPLSEISIEVLALPLRAENCLRMNELHTLADTLEAPSTWLLRQPNFGKTSYAELLSALAELGLTKEN